MGFTDFPNGITSFGVPVYGGSYGPSFGTTWYVDGTNGLNGNSGLEPNKAFKTIQRGISVQIANTTSLGDTIYILPGTYAEELTGALTDVQLVGACPHSPGAVKVEPTGGSAYRGVMTRAAIRNIALYNSTSTNPTYASLSITTMYDSLVDNCQIVGASDTEGATGIRIGTEGTSVGSERMWGSRISNCTWRHYGTGLNNHEYGIVFGLTGSTSQAASRSFRYSEICYNHIYAQVQGIEININSANGGGGSIHHNVVGSSQFNGNCSSYGIEATESGEPDQLIKVYLNHINASDPIRNFFAGNCTGNWVSVDSAEPDREFPDSAA